VSHEVEAAAALMGRARHASLGTLTPEGAPYVSLVACARVGPRPLLLLSRLAEHTKNLLERPDVSLLYVDGDAADPLAAGRVTLLGRCSAVSEEDVAASRERFLAVHPSASQYVGFGDFAFYVVEPTALRVVFGFGRMTWIEARDLVAG
jgi:putative heme iron utilization protein